MILLDHCSRGLRPTSFAPEPRLLVLGAQSSTAANPSDAGGSQLHGVVDTVEKPKTPKIRTRKLLILKDNISKETQKKDFFDSLVRQFRRCDMCFIWHDHQEHHC
jgi:hypothetical protein